MRLPFLQVAEKFITVQSKVVARMLGIDRATAIGMGNLLFESVVELTSTDEFPPTGIIVGDDAADIIEASMEWNGERGKAFGAFVRADVIERLEQGARVKGCDRYAAAWEKQRKRSIAEHRRASPGHSGSIGLEHRRASPEHSSIRSEHARMAANARWRQKNHAHDAQLDAQPMLNDAQNAPQTETETETETEKKQRNVEVGPPAASLRTVPEPEELEPDPATGDYRPTPWGFWGWHEAERQRQGLFGEGKPPDDWLEWATAALGKVGIGGLSLSYCQFLLDETFRTRGWPIRVFMSEAVWLPRASSKPPAKRQGAWR